MPELKSITKHFSKFMINDILKKDDKSKKDSKRPSTQEPITVRERKPTSTVQEDDVDNSKKPRQCFTTLQVEELEKLFLTTNYPDTYTRQQLANKMDVSETRIQIWFQNRRAKIRRQKKHHRRSFQGNDFLYPYRSNMDYMKSNHPPSHRYSLPPMDNKSPPPPYHRYSSPPLDNFFLRQISSNNMDTCRTTCTSSNLPNHCHACTTLPNPMPYFEHKLLNPACLRVCQTSDYDARSRSFSR